MIRPPALQRIGRVLVYASAFACSLLLLPAFSQSPPIVLSQTIPLPGVRGRLDHLDIDSDGARLFVAALGNDSVEVIDLRTGRRSAHLEHLREPQGVAYLPDAKRLLVANGGNGRVDILSGPALTSAVHIDGLEDADNARYDLATRKAYVGYGNALAVIDPAPAKVARRIMLHGHPESFQLETTGPRIFVNVPSAAEIVVVDRNTGSVLSGWRLGQMRANYPMAFDEPEHRLFVGTRRPAALLVYDTDTGKRVARVPIGGDVDDLFFDSDRKRVYAICGEGNIDVVQQVDSDHYRRIVEVPTAPGARTGRLSAARRALYVAVPARGASVAEIRVYAVR